MAAPALTSAAAGWNLQKDPDGAPSSGTSGSSQATSSVPEAPKNVPGKAILGTSQVEDARKKTDQEDEVNKCPIKCAVPCCTRTGERLLQTTYFPCPLEPHPSSRLWAKAIGVKFILKNMYICEDHFQLEDDLENYLKFKYYPRGQQRFPRFKKGVVPWKFPKCRGTNPIVHQHRVPFSKTEYYKRQRARINKARVILASKENEISAKRCVEKSKRGYNSKVREPSGAKTEQAATGNKDCNGENKRTVKAKKNRRSSAKTQKAEEVKNVSSSEKDRYFKMLNGDLSTLIAHVQPAICSWDVSEVRMDPSGNVRQAGSENGLQSSTLESQGSSPVVEKVSSDSKAEQAAGVENNLEKSTPSENSISNVPESPKAARKSESASNQKTDEESEDEVYMTPSEDEANLQDTSDTDFTVSSEESWGEREIPRPTRRSARNRSQRSQRTDRYSPPIVLRSRAKKRTPEKSPVAAVTADPNQSSPRSIEKSPQPNKASGVQTSDSGISVSLGVVESCANVPSNVTTTDPDEGGEDGSGTAATVQNKPKAAPASPKKSHVENVLHSNGSNPEVMRAVGSSDSESVGDVLEDNRKTDESSLPKPQSSSTTEETPTNLKNAGTNSRKSFRMTKPSVKGAHLSVDMSDTVAKVFIPESQTSYSYKRVNVESKPGSSGTNYRRKGKKDNFLLVRDGDQVLSGPSLLPKHISGLIANMRTTFDAFFDNLDELKTEAKKGGPSENVDSRLNETTIDKLLDELKTYPDLLELEMAQFVVKCEKYYDDQMEKKLKESKKIRWCNSCQSAARFHCCFSAAYCSRLCQTKDWGRHHRHCGQSRMLLDDPDLKLNPVMAHRLKSLEYSKPTIGSSIANLEELHRSLRRPANGQKIILGSKSQPRNAKRGNASGVMNTSNTAVKRPKFTYYAVKSYPGPASTAQSVSANGANHFDDSVNQSAEAGSATIKTEPPDIDMEVEPASPPSGSNSVLRHSLVNNSSTNSPTANQQVRITIPPNLLASLPSNVRPVVNAVSVTNRIGQSDIMTVNSVPRITSVAMVPRSNSGGNTLVVPKNTSPGTATSSPVTLRCRTVILPSGETQYIPVDGQTWSFKPNAQLVVKHLNQSTGVPVAIMRQATTSGSSILITRPSKPAYSKFMPITPAPTQTTSAIVSPEVSAVELPDAPPPLTPRLPKLTPVTPKPEPAVVRTLDSSELDKILSTDHLKEAFDMSYASNILRP